MVRIYTRTGDGGETALGDGTRVSKAGARVALYGEVDELNSWLGYCGVALGNLGVEVPGLTGDDIHLMQSRLFSLGAVLADPVQSAETAVLPVQEQPFSAEELEALIDAMEAFLPPLKTFILPGGCAAAASLHLARTVCRRVERMAVMVGKTEPVPAGAIAYLNRLSDFLFTAARAANSAAGVSDIPWIGKKGDG